MSTTNGVTPTEAAKELNGTDSTNKDAQTNGTIKDDTPRGSLCEAKNLAQKTSQLGQVEVVERDAIVSKTEYSKYAFVSKQVYNPEGKHEKTIVEINSPQLLKALRDTVKFYPAEALVFETQATYESPFMLLNHYANELKEYGRSSPDVTTKDHIDLLQDVLTAEADDEGVEATKLIQSGLISFKSLWRICKPGDLFYNEDYGHSRLHVLQKIGYGKDARMGPYVEATVSFTAHDGTRAGTAIDTIKLWEYRHFVGGSNAKITSLPLFPLKFLEAQDGLMDQLTKRGRQYLEIGGKGLFEYDGLHQYLKSPPDDFYSECAEYSGMWLPQTGSGRVVVDARTFAEEKAKQRHSLLNALRRM